VTAAQFICDAAAASPGCVTVLALASLTNVALALRRDPSLATTLAGLVVLGGAFNCMGNVNPAAEANIWHDPEAADEALGAFPDGVCSIVGLDVTQASVMSGPHLDALRDAGGRFSSYCWSICQFYKAYHARSVGLDGIYLHDPTALAAVLAPQHFGWAEGRVRVATAGVARGKTLMDTGVKKCACARGMRTWHERTRVCMHAAADACVCAACARSWVGANDWTGRPLCRVALTLDAPAVLALVTQRLTQDAPAGA
jgi:uridine nucleosidase